jgi:hypothetical protein
MLPIVGVVGLEMCTNGALPISRTRHIILLPKLGSLLLHRSVTRRFADALIEKGDRQGVNHTPV